MWKTATLLKVTLLPVMHPVFFWKPLSAGNLGEKAQMDIIMIFEELFSVINMYGFMGRGYLLWKRCNYYVLSTINHMIGRAIWVKLPDCIFENFEIAWVKRGQCQNSQKPRGWFIPKITRTKPVITG